MSYDPEDSPREFGRSFLIPIPGGLIMFWIIKHVSLLFYPLTLSVLLLLIALVLLGFTPRQRAGKVLVGVALLILIGFGNIDVGRRLLRPLETAYPALLEAPTETLGASPWIVILGTGHNADPKIPVTSQIGSGFLTRMLEGLRLHREIPGSRLLVFLSGPSTDKEKEQFRDAFSRVVGVNPDDLVLIGTARTTVDESRLAKERIGDAPFILVTSALHMRRAVSGFEQEGMRPIPAPCSFGASERRTWNFMNLYPSPGGLGCSRTAIHEYVGSAWLGLREIHR